MCVAGALEEVDMVRSTQWLECRDCQCEDVVEGRCKSFPIMSTFCSFTLTTLFFSTFPTSTFRCKNCGGSEVKKRIELIVRIGKDWVELSQERATSLLPAIQDAPSFHHLRTVEPKTILALNIPPFLAMVVEGGSLRELKPLGEI